MNTPSKSRMIGVSSYVMCSIAILCFMAAVQSNAKPLARPQRQVLAGELATGLTGTGTSFNSLYDGQVADSYYGYQPEQRGQYDISRPNLGKGYNNWNQGGYNNNGGYKGTYGAGKGGIGGVGYGAGAGFSGNRPGIGSNNDWSAWQGFGAGKNYSPYGASRPISQSGVKY